MRSMPKTKRSMTVRTNAADWFFRVLAAWHSLGFYERACGGWPVYIE